MVDVKRHPPSLPQAAPLHLDYHDPTPSGIRRRPRPILFPVGLILAGLILGAGLIYGIAIIILMMRGMGRVQDSQLRR